MSELTASCSALPRNAGPVLAVTVLLLAEEVVAGIGDVEVFDVGCGGSTVVVMVLNGGLTFDVDA